MKIIFWALLSTFVACSKGPSQREKLMAAAHEHEIQEEREAEAVTIRKKLPQPQPYPQSRCGTRPPRPGWNPQEWRWSWWI